MITVSHFSTCKFLSLPLDVSIDKYNNEIGEAIGTFMCNNGLDLDSTYCFGDLIEVLSSTEIEFKKPSTLIRGACLAIEKFISDEGLCLNYLKILFSKLSEDESKNKYICHMMNV